MKRVYLVTVRVEARGNNDFDFKMAERGLKDNPPHLNLSSVGIHGADYSTGYALGGRNYRFSVRTLKSGVTVKAKKKGRRK